MMAIRASFLIDGFNMYHSLKTLQGMSGASVKWLDLRKLCENYLQAVRSALGERVELQAVHWFSARPNHLANRSPDTLRRYDTYAAVLRHTGVEVHLSQFKRKDVRCPHCKRSFSRNEEKETDVDIAVRLLEVLVGQSDTAVVVSGDTDLIPAIRAVNRLLPRSKIGIGFPFMRHNNELEEAADYSFKINQKDVQRAQLPNEIELADGIRLTRPPTW